MSLAQDREQVNLHAINQKEDLFKLLDVGLDDMEAGRISDFDDVMRRVEEHYRHEI